MNKYWLHYAIVIMALALVSSGNSSCEEAGNQSAKKSGLTFPHKPASLLFESPVRMSEVERVSSYLIRYDCTKLHSVYEFSSGKEVFCWEKDLSGLEATDIFTYDEQHEELVIVSGVRLVRWNLKARKLISDEMIEKVEFSTSLRHKTVAVRSNYCVIAPKFCASLYAGMYKARLFRKIEGIWRLEKTFDDGFGVLFNSSPQLGVLTVKYAQKLIFCTVFNSQTGKECEPVIAASTGWDYSTAESAPEKPRRVGSHWMMGYDTRAISSDSIASWRFNDKKISIYTLGDKENVLGGEYQQYPEWITCDGTCLFVMTGGAINKYSDFISSPLEVETKELGKLNGYSVAVSIDCSAMLRLEVDDEEKTEKLLLVEISDGCKVTLLAENKNPDLSLSVPGACLSRNGKKVVLGIFEGMTATKSTDESSSAKIRTLFYLIDLES